jgi:predicted nicotinamide N-methyase
MTAETDPTRRPLHETPDDALGPPVREDVIVNGRTFTIVRPGDSDITLDHPFVRRAFAADEYMPYWMDLWPGARMLAKVILREPWVTPNVEVLEVGCGLGLPGIAALACGLKVIFSDYDATALRFAADNARANGFTDFRLLQMDWRDPPADLRVPVILASDLTYEMRNVEPLLALVKRVLLPGGVCLLTDQDRPPMQHLRRTLDEERFAYTTELVRAGEPGGRRVKGTLYRIRLPGETFAPRQASD